jgi:hypothetical protein
MAARVDLAPCDKGLTKSDSGKRPWLFRIFGFWKVARGPLTREQAFCV